LVTQIDKLNSALPQGVDPGITDAEWSDIWEMLEEARGHGRISERRDMAPGTYWMRWPDGWHTGEYDGAYWTLGGLNGKHRLKTFGMDDAEIRGPVPPPEPPP
jgi:hypothetical protein